MPTLKPSFAIVADFGKTHARLSLWTRDGQMIDRASRVNEHIAASPYAPLDTAGNASWLIETLKSFAEHPVEAIIPVAHGAAIAGIRSGALAFPPPDYEWPIPDNVLKEYRTGRDPFALTGSPAYPHGLNIGSQLHYLETSPGGLPDDAVLVPYAQYWAWLLSGVAVSEVTSLGCHSDLWCPAQGTFSPMARRRGWAARFAPIARAGEVIGTLRPELASLTGLSRDVRIHAGLHDSNAALIAARAYPEIDGREATVLSTGTWFIAMRTPAQPVNLAELPESRDCLVNVDAYGQPVPSSRWMGGRELELLKARIDHPGTDGLEEVLAQGVMILPALVQNCGPFPGGRHHWQNEPAAPAVHTAAAALYAALMADASLDLIGARDVLLIEGRFAASELFIRALATLRPDMTVFTAPGEADASFGALRMIDPAIRPAQGLRCVAPLNSNLAEYRAQWRARTGTTGQ